MMIPGLSEDEDAKKLRYPSKVVVAWTKVRRCVKCVADEHARTHARTEDAQVRDKLRPNIIALPAAIHQRFTVRTIRWSTLGGRTILLLSRNRESQFQYKWVDQTRYM